MSYDAAPTDPHHGGKLTIEQYHAEINRLAVARKLIVAGETMYDAEAWRDMYEDGLSPSDALDEEMAVMAEM